MHLSTKIDFLLTELYAVFAVWLLSIIKLEHFIDIDLRERSLAVVHKAQASTIEGRDEINHLFLQTGLVCVCVLVYILRTQVYEDTNLYYYMGITT